jgi:hypothetical protein
MINGSFCYQVVKDFANAKAKAGIGPEHDTLHIDPMSW